MRYCNILLLFLLFSAGQALPQTPAPQGRISIEFNHMDIRTALETLARMKQMNIVLDREATGHVTLRHHDVTWEEAFEAVLRAGNLYATGMGGVESVKPLENR